MSACCASRINAETARTELLRLGLEAPELQEFQNEPAQMTSGAVGKTGYLRLGFTHDGNRSVLSDLDRRVPFLVQKALYWDECIPDMPCVFIITTTGCMLQGDRMALEIRVDDGAKAHVTTQSATKVHMMNANYAVMNQDLVIGEGAYLEYMPDPIIPHRTSRYLSNTTIHIAETGSLLYSEVLLPGRKFHHADETFGFSLYSSTISAKRTGRNEQLFEEKSILKPKEINPYHAGIMNGAEVFGNVLLLTTPEKARAVRDASGCEVNAAKKIAYGATLLPYDCGVLFKVLGPNSETVKTIIRDFWQIARNHVTGNALPSEFLWR